MKKLNMVQSISSRREEQHLAITAEARELALRKNKEYGDAISTSGMAGCSIELIGTSHRVWELVQGAIRTGYMSPEFKQQIHDKALDSINYSVWLLAFLGEENLAGTYQQGAENK